MNVLIITLSDIFGGAARAVYRLFKGLKAVNTPSCMIVKQKHSTDPQVVPVSLNGNRAKHIEEEFVDIQNKYIKRNRSALSDSAFTFPYPGFDLSDLSLVRQADVINMHDIRGFQSVETIARLLELNKPVVWTLHDQNAFTGGCHYTAGCRKYQVDCRDCPQLMDNRYQIPFAVLKNKIKHWRKNLTIVTPSRWLAECAGESRVFRNFRIETIANSLETDIYRPVDKQEAKQQLKLDPDTTVILYGSLFHVRKRKGFSQFLESIQYCLRDRKFTRAVRKKEVQFVTVGETHRHLPDLPFPLISLGKIESDELMSCVYAAADLFVLPSLEDNLPNTMLEAMACGTPVVAFEVGGIPDVITSGENGCIVPTGNVGKMGACILDLVFDKKKRKELGSSAAEFIKSNFSLLIQGNRYLDLFKDLSLPNDSRNDENISSHNFPEFTGAINIQNIEQEIDPDFRSNIEVILPENEKSHGNFNIE